MKLEDRKIQAKQLHARGYNCAQCVAMSFSDITSCDTDTIARIAMGLGGGVGAQGQICGVVLGMTMVLGCAHDAHPSSKPAVNALVRNVTNQFCSRNNGFSLCRDLKTKTKRSCDELIADGIEIIQSYLDERK